MDDRRTYVAAVWLNGRRFRRIVIDPHYEAKHGEHMNDDLILELVRSLNGQRVPTETVTSDGFSFHKVDPVWLAGKPHRLVLVTHEREDFIGVVNAFRRRRSKV